MNLQSLRGRLARATAQAPRDLPDTPESIRAGCDLLSAELGVWVALKVWAERRPDYQPLPAPTIPHEPDAADRKMAAQCKQLALLAEPHLIHAPGVVDQWMEGMFRQYERSGEHDTEIDAALTKVDEQLQAIVSGDVAVPKWSASTLAALQRFPKAGNSAG